MTPNELPTFEAQWWPVQMETVPGSNERLTVAVVVRARTGQATVRQTISPPTLAAMFGTAGKGMCLVVGETVLELDRQLKNMVPVQQLELPFGNIDLGPERDCLARDLNETFDIAMRLSSGFSMSLFGAKNTEQGDGEAREAFAEWAEKVRLQVLATEWQDKMIASFNLAITLSSKRKLRVGFMHDGYVAQFGVLRPGRSIGADVRALKLRLFDLDSLRRDQLLVLRKAELLVGYQAAGDAFTKRQRESLNDAWAFVAHEAKQRNVVTVQCTDAEAAARHLHESLLAA